MQHSTRTTIIGLGAAVALSLAYYLIDPLYLPLVFAGPIISGAVVGARGGAWRGLAVAWGVSGIVTLVWDWVAFQEDVAFHAVVTAWMLATSALGWRIARAVRERRARRADPAAELA